MSGEAPHYGTHMDLENDDGADDYFDDRSGGSDPGTNIGAHATCAEHAADRAVDTAEWNELIAPKRPRLAAPSPVPSPTRATAPPLLQLAGRAVLEQLLDADPDTWAELVFGGRLSEQRLVNELVRHRRHPTHALGEADFVDVVRPMRRASGSRGRWRPVSGRATLGKQHHTVRAALEALHRRVARRVDSAMRHKSAQAAHVNGREAQWSCADMPHGFLLRHIGVKPERYRTPGYTVGLTDDGGFYVAMAVPSRRNALAAARRRRSPREALAGILFVCYFAALTRAMPELLRRLRDAGAPEGVWGGPMLDEHMVELLAAFGRSGDDDFADYLGWDEGFGEEARDLLEHWAERCGIERRSLLYDALIVRFGGGWRHTQQPAHDGEHTGQFRAPALVLRSSPQSPAAECYRAAERMLARFVGKPTDREYVVGEPEPVAHELVGLDEDDARRLRASATRLGGAYKKQLQYHTGPWWWRNHIRGPRPVWHRVPRLTIYLPQSWMSGALLERLADAESDLEQDFDNWRDADAQPYEDADSGSEYNEPDFEGLSSSEGDDSGVDAANVAAGAYGADAAEPDDDDADADHGE